MDQIWDRMPLLESASICLRELAERDLPALYALWSDPEVTRYWSAEPMRTNAQAAAKLAVLVQAFASREALQWGISPTRNGELIGTCTLWRLDLEQRRAEVGIILARQYWGRGHASAALAGMLRYGFEIMQLHRLEADVDPENLASLRLFERHGFRREGLLRERWQMAGRWCDSVLLGLLETEWRLAAGVQER